MARKTRTRRSFGAIRRLPSGRYQASYTGPDTARHNAPVTFETRLDAEGWLHRQHRAIGGDDWTPPAARRAPITVATYAAAWMADRDLKATTRAHYQQLLARHVLPTLGAMLVKQVTPAAVRTWHAQLDTGPTAKAHAYSLLRTVLGTAVDDDLLPANPCRVRGAGSAKQVKQIEPASISELAIIEANMSDRLRLFVPLAAWAALRFGEAAELRRRDVDLQRGLLRIRRGVVRVTGRTVVQSPKSSAGVRDVAIPPHLIPAIRQHLRDHAQIGADGLLFYSPRDGTQLAHSTLLGQFRRAAEAAGRPDLTPHALRHTGATMAASTGATLAELMSRLGHTTPTMALRYQHVAAGRDAEVAKALSDLATDGG